MMKSIHLKIFYTIVFMLVFMLSTAQETQKLYLSGTGNDKTVEWEFYCTSGRNSGKWTTIQVPSNWETQGFGKYNYGHAKDTARGKESGLYRYRFQVPPDWKNKIIHIVFDGSMTDTEVKINGKKAGPIHQGAFYRFRYEITNLLKFNAINLLEVKVDKHSSNYSVNRAERFADYWIFGGIFRPVCLEALPKQNISFAAIKAGHEGRFTASVWLENIEGADEITAQVFNMKGERIGNIMQSKIAKNNSVVNLQGNFDNPDQWSPEFPNLYKVEFNLLQKGKIVHCITEHFGFRTLELLERDGIYLNGKKIKFRGICRHSFWPESGRTLNKDLSIADVNLMKDMNMNAVRNSHYPADNHFYDACDSLGLMVLDELGGWHDAYDTEVGTRLVKEMLFSNMNHPSIVMWVNGNEGGHNHNLLPLYDSLDIQKRPVIHAWETFRGMDTQHYINYNYGNGTHFQGHEVFFPTEFLHGLYDGGHGAGLDDYWELMWRHPLSAGGFLWVFSDEAVVRTDRNGELDSDGNHAADGILGPYREKEGSFFTVKEVWSPIWFEPKEITPAFDGSFKIENRSFFTNLKDCRFNCQFAQITNPFGGEKVSTNPIRIEPPDIAPGEEGMLRINMPANWSVYDILYLSAFDPHGREIYTWSWPLQKPVRIAEKIITTDGSKKITVNEHDSMLIVAANEIRIKINKNTGLLQEIENQKGIIPFGNGPVLCDGKADFKALEYKSSGENLEIHYTFGKESHYNNLVWTVYPSGWLKLEVKYCPAGYESAMMGISFSYPENLVKGIKWLGDGPYHAWKNRVKGNTLGVWEKKYNNTITGEKDFIYPEFKGYHSRFYCAEILTKEQPFRIVCATEDIFLRLFTPGSPKDAYNTAPPFPPGDISLMHGIPPIGTKSQKPENMGPSGRLNMYYDYGRKRPKELTCYFDFSAR
ncbi:MAG: glycoside hydrolase family 2 [Bacteroidales bacterium]|nr:glycoside hydrolase family 2 [Bacteroidales bacterium]